jgi:hypothetical protein
MPLKTTEIEGVTYAIVSDGKPVYVDDSGQEQAYDGEELANRVTALNGEAMGFRKEKEKLAKQLEAYSGIEDPAAAAKALETLASLDQKKLVDAGKVDEIKAAAIAATEEKYAPIVSENDSLKKALTKEMIGGRFARSSFIQEKLVAPVPMVEATFGPNFGIEDGKVVAKYPDGNPVFSKARPGELADFDEALSLLVNSSTFKDSILKGAGQRGSGAEGGNGGQGGSKQMTRSEYEKMAPTERQAKLNDGYSLVDG